MLFARTVLAPGHVERTATTLLAELVEAQAAAADSYPLIDRSTYEHQQSDASAAVGRICAVDELTDVISNPIRPSEGTDSPTAPMRVPPSPNLTETDGSRGADVGVGGLEE